MPGANRLPVMIEANCCWFLSLKTHSMHPRCGSGVNKIDNCIRGEGTGRVRTLV